MYNIIFSIYKPIKFWLWGYSGLSLVREGPDGGVVIKLWEERQTSLSPTNLLFAEVKSSEICLQYNGGDSIQTGAGRSLWQNNSDSSSQDSVWPRLNLLLSTSLAQLKCLIVRIWWNNINVGNTEYDLCLKSSKY